MRISFEYDGTLATHAIEKLCVDAIKDGHTVFIVTKREKIARKGAVDQKIPVIFLAERLGIPKKRIIFTSRELKAAFLVKHRIECHIDNCRVELFFIKKSKEVRIQCFHVSEKRLKEKFKRFLERR